MALSVYFAKRHCFPSKTVPKGQGYTKIQSHLWHLGKGFTVKEVLYQLATTYTVWNKILGQKMGSPMPGTEDSDDGVGSSLTQQEILSYQSKAFSYIHSIRDKRNKFKLFCKDETLARIRADHRLHHQYCPPWQENTNDDVIIDIIIAFRRFERTLLVRYLLHLPQKTSNVE